MVHTIRAVYNNRWARYAATLVLLAAVLWRIQPGRIATSISSANGLYLGMAALLTIPFLAVKAARWFLMLRAAAVRATFGEACVSLVGGMGLALVTPARIGEVVRGAYIRDPQKLRIGGLVLVDKGFDVLALAALSVAGGWVLLGRWVGIALAAATAVGLVMVYEPRYLRLPLEATSARLPMRSKVEGILGSLESLTPVASTEYLSLTFLSFAIVLVQFALVLASWRAPTFEIVLLTFPLVILTNVLPITVGGLGVREGAAILLLAHFSVSPAHAALAAFLMFFINTAVPGIVGALALPAAGSASPRPIVDQS